MKTPKQAIAAFMLATIFVLSACGAQATPAPAATEAAIYEAPATEAPATEALAAPYDIGEEQAKAAESEGNTLPSMSGPDYTPQNIQYTQRKIIKNAEIRLQVEDTDVAIDRSTQIVADTGGYIISSRVWHREWFDTSYKYASITIGVPVDQFEPAMRRLRNLAVQVIDEKASGKDVTDEFVDLQSRLENLEATRDRIRSFLDQAKTVEEALQVNQQLAEVEAEIEQVKGRMSYLTDRSAYSTITIQLEPVLPDPPATPSPTPVPATPTATPVAWDPGKTAHNAGKTVVGAYQGLIELAIWFFVVVVPIVGPPIFIIWLLIRLFGRKRSQPPEE
jgi:uncharacterized coiled-coil protein SlyX